MLDDRSIYARWAANREALEAAESQRGPDREVRIAELEREATKIGYDWNALFVRKKRGEITDPYSIELAATIVTEIAKLNGIHARVSRSHVGAIDARHPPEIVGLFAKIDSDQSDELIQKFARRATLDMLAHPEVVPLAGVPIDRGPDWDARPYAEQFKIGKMAGRPCVQWHLSLWVWEGPGHPFLSRIG